MLLLTRRFRIVQSVCSVEQEIENHLLKYSQCWTRDCNVVADREFEMLSQML